MRSASMIVSVFACVVRAGQVARTGESNRVLYPRGGRWRPGALPPPCLLRRACRIMFRFRPSAADATDRISMNARLACLPVAFLPVLTPLMAALLLAGCATGAGQGPRAGTTATLAVLETTDVHSNVVGYDYYKLAEDKAFG